MSNPPACGGQDSTYSSEIYVINNKNGGFEANPPYKKSDGYKSYAACLTISEREMRPTRFAYTSASVR